MARYLAGRIAGLVLILFLVCLFTYLIFFKLSPDPALMICGKTCTPERVTQIRTLLGIDQPFLTQYGDFLSGLFVGRDYGSGANLVHCPAPCLGYSFQTNQSVWQMVVGRLPVTATLAIGAAALWLLAGITAGLLSAVKEGTWWDRAPMNLALGGASIPNYVLALALQYVLVVKLQILPFPSSVAFTDDPGLWFQSYLMPWFVLATGAACLYARLVVFQDPFSSLNPRHTVERILMAPLDYQGIAPPGGRRVYTKELMERVGLDPDRSQRYPAQFSGGQAQRIGIARALAVNPKLVICDEAVSALDVSVQAQVIELLLRLQRESGFSYLFIAHDLAVVRRIAHRVAVMSGGRIVEQGPCAQVFDDPRDPYTRTLLAAIPRINPEWDRRRRAATA